MRIKFCDHILLISEKDLSHFLWVYITQGVPHEAFFTWFITILVLSIWAWIGKYI